MSVTVTAQVYATRLGSGVLKAVALKLADHANDIGGNIFPSLETVALHTELSKSTVQRAIRKLLKTKILKVDSAGGKGPGHATRYKFDLGKLASAPRLKDARPKKGSHSDHLTTDAKVVTDAAEGSQPDHQTVKRTTIGEPAPQSVAATEIGSEGLTEIAAKREPFQREWVPGSQDWLIPFDDVTVPGIIATGAEQATRARANVATDKRVLPFTPEVLFRIGKLAVDRKELIARYFKRTKGKRIDDPSAYLLRMAYDAVAKRDGVSAEHVAVMDADDLVARAKLLAAEMEPTATGKATPNGSALIAALGR